jgi:DNA-dependent RNA polymerase auxiliary subunit epsilon
MRKEKGISINVLKKRRDAAIKRLSGGKPLMEGSLGKKQVTCGNPNCRCMKDGEKHISHVLTKKVRGKTKSLYVPVDMVEEVSEWIKEHRRVKEELKKISALSEQIIKQHVSTKQAVSKHLKRQKESRQT